ncbi:class I SAM-dependent methyltransferase [Aureivirga sp. CE67]|uniref:class I SAM-dependent methyltransferase n=1 Tax=Aureivirga sp. CE67 TaxID=1788983 RepID=UPI0018CBC5DB|nr:class I SAM-dependent methyltransferase [Aureivirga sp. CE67]
MKVPKDWFTTWFNTEYYHLLYNNRDDSEAQSFMKNLTSYLKLPQSATILDLPCGKGRHSKYLSSLGFHVTGMDLSENSIEFAKQFENENLVFKVHDMREPFPEKFDAIFNLFTSFGYFEEDKFDIQVLQNIKHGLNEGGVAVIDFMNVEKVEKNLVKKEIQQRDKVDFHIERAIEDGFIVKQISFNAKNKDFVFYEKVKYLNLSKIESYLEQVGLKLITTFGGYNLEPFNKETSNRLILVVE